MPYQKALEVLTVAAVKNEMLIFPNPATINFTIKAEGLGKGIARLGIDDFFSMRLLKEVSYQVDNKLQAVINTNGLPIGAYVVEIVTPKVKIRRKLILK